MNAGEKKTMHTYAHHQNKSVEIFLFVIIIIVCTSIDWCF